MSSQLLTRLRALLNGALASALTAGRGRAILRAQRPSGGSMPCGRTRLRGAWPLASRASTTRVVRLITDN
jgi:hypothetical protein